MNLWAIIDQLKDRSYYKILICSAKTGEAIDECEYIDGGLESENEHSLYEEFIDYSLCFVDGLATLMVWQEEVYE